MSLTETLGKIILEIAQEKAHLNKILKKHEKRLLKRGRRVSKGKRKKAK